MHNKHRSEFSDRWSERVRKTRKHFMFERLYYGAGVKSVQELKKHLFQDFQYIYDSLYHTLKHFKHYSRVLKNEYGVSFLQQLYQISYLIFVLRQHPKMYLKYHLFKPEVWHYADNFTYSHYQIQQIVAKKLYPEDLDILLNKLKFHQFCVTNKISSPKILGYYYNGDPVSPEGDFEMPEQDIFVKEIEGQMGIGAKRFSFIDDAYKDIDGKIFSEENLLQFLRDYSIKNSSLMIQPVIRNHKTWLPFTSGALATCRAVTAKKPDTNSTELLFASLRMPVGNTDVDNYSQGGLVSAIHIGTGVLNKAYCSIPTAGKFEFDSHPDTAQVITGSVLPDWDKLVQFILKLHHKLKSPFIGWDVVLTESGCMALEGNVYWGPGASYEAAHHLPFSESNYPLLFESWIGDELDMLINESDFEIRA